MGIFKLFGNKETISTRKPQKDYADSSSVSEDERSFYQPDSYYTLFSYPGTIMERRVITFDERKKTTFPSTNGLYVAEILLLEYCATGKYPKPASGYPGFWWFEYGIRDVGHALESLYSRGFLKWAPKTAAIMALKVNELKQILQDAGLSTVGKKADLVDRISNEIPEALLSISSYSPKYELTELGKTELENNGYVVYMRNHPHKTTEDSTYGLTFTVWDINKLFPDGDASNWREVVGKIEEERFGVNVANADNSTKDNTLVDNPTMRAKEIRSYLHEKADYIAACAEQSGDGYDEERKGFDYVRIGKDKDAIIQFYISIRKGFDAPALYSEAAKLLRKYGLYKEAISVLNTGIKNVPQNNRHREKLSEMREELKEHIKKSK